MLETFALLVGLFRLTGSWLPAPCRGIATGDSLFCRWVPGSVSLLGFPSDLRQPGRERIAAFQIPNSAPRSLPRLRPLLGFKASPPVPVSRIRNAP
ncbi:hypothetical protein chiPu_0026574 [Chiloscyllium punctatum]|uniref:Secreted protein n=1 Tax=Chiloscyllium punctatum TaxID=137246 RepID=A0A401TJ04_CHIPU|nr:hypothetical protein [Chiloscyllium punctatum]